MPVLLTGDGFWRFSDMFWRGDENVPAPRTMFFLSEIFVPLGSRSTLRPSGGAARSWHLSRSLPGFPLVGKAVNLGN